MALGYSLACAVAFVAVGVLVRWLPREQEHDRATCICPACPTRRRVLAARRRRARREAA